MKELLADIKESLLHLADEEIADKLNKKHPTKMHLLGIKTPQLKEVLREIKIMIKGYTPTEKLSLIKGLIDDGIFEMQQLAYGILVTEKSVLRTLKPKDLNTLSKNLDNRHSVDYFAIYFVGYLWKENLITIDFIKQYLKSKDPWIKRIAISATIALNKKTKGNKGGIDQSTQILKLAIKDHSDIIAEAMGNALVAISKIDQLAASEFIENYDESLSNNTKKIIAKKLNF